MYIGITIYQRFFFVILYEKRNGQETVGPDNDVYIVIAGLIKPTCLLPGWSVKLQTSAVNFFRFFFFVRASESAFAVTIHHTV